MIFNLFTNVERYGLEMTAQDAGDMTFLEKVARERNLVLDGKTIRIMLNFVIPKIDRNRENYGASSDSDNDAE